MGNVSGSYRPYEEVPIPNHGIGPFIRKRREELGWSQKVLADAIGLSQSLLSAWENSVSTPSAQHIPDLARALQTEQHLFLEALEHTEVRNTAKPRTIDAILSDAEQFLADHPSELWLMGPNHLPVLESGSARKAWLDNLGEGYSYNLIWVLDSITPEDLKTALPHFAQIAEEAAQNGSACGGALGRIRFYAVNASQAVPQAAATYERFRTALQLDESRAKEQLDVVPYDSLDEWEQKAPIETQALRIATGELVRIWQPETSIILYQPRSLVTPPVANIQLMPVNERINTKEGAAHRPMYWLRHIEAAKVSHVVANLQDAIQALRERVVQIQERARER